MQSDRLELGIEGEFRTLDGALSAQLSGYLLQGRPGFSFENPASSLRANLRDARGTLEVLPDEDLALLHGLLTMDLFFEADATAGDLRLYLRLVDSSGNLVHYTPLSGHWPDTGPNARAADAENAAGASGGPEG